MIMSTLFLKFIKFYKRYLLTLLILVVGSVNLYSQKKSVDSHFYLNLGLNANGEDFIPFMANHRLTYSLFTFGYAHDVKFHERVFTRGYQYRFESDMLSFYFPNIINYLSGIRFYDKEFRRHQANFVNVLNSSLLFYKKNDWLLGTNFRGFMWASDGIPYDYLSPLRGALGLSVAKSFSQNSSLFKFNLDVFRTIPLPFLLRDYKIGPGNLYGLQFRTSYSHQSYKKVELYSDLTYLQNSQLWPKLGLDKGYIYQWQFGCRVKLGLKR